MYPNLLSLSPSIFLIERINSIIAFSKKEPFPFVSIANPLFPANIGSWYYYYAVQKQKQNKKNYYYYYYIIQTFTVLITLTLLF